MSDKTNKINFCSEIIGDWRFTKESIEKIKQITDKTKIIERGGILCGKIENSNSKKHLIDLISECKGDRCSVETDIDPFKICKEHYYVDTFGVFHTHPGKIEKTLPSIADLMFQMSHGQLMCIGAPKAKKDRIICIKNKSIAKDEDIEKRKRLEELYKLERKIRNLPFYTTKKERKDYDIKFKDLFSEKYYYKFDPSNCTEK